MQTKLVRLGMAPFVAGAVGGMILAFPFVGKAIATKTVTGGGNCHLTSAADTATADAHATSAFYIWSTTPTRTWTAYCPLTRLNSDLPPTKILASVQDLHTSLDVTCQLWHVSAAGSAAGASTVSTSGTNASVVNLNLPIPATHFLSGTYDARCDMPNRLSPNGTSGLYRLIVEEP